MVSVFFSYSHKDEALRDQLETHLALLKNQGLIDAWYDRRIVAGSDVDDSIFEKLETADIILLLVSSDFLSSSYCYSREMQRAMERHDSKEARVIPVILRHCDWHGAPFGKLMAAPRDGKPVTSWPDRDEALADVAKQIRKAVEAASASASASRPAGATLVTQRAPSSGLINSLPRSSNLRLRKEFSEQDRDEFLLSTFEYVCKFFRGSIRAVGERNPEVKGRFERIDSRHMAALLYRGGEKIAECSVRVDGFSRDNGIAFSHDATVRQGSFNELLNVKADDQSLFLTTMGMSFSGNREKQLSPEGAAEFLWELFIKPAQ